ncbi:MAG: hypothetical protein ACM3ON_12815 [Chloroflexota bacterium]
MTTRAALSMFLLLLTAACAPTVTVSGIESIASIPKDTYFMYLYSGGQGGWTRVAFLKSLDAGVDVIPYSPQIAQSTGTFAEALAFMRGGSGYRDITTRQVNFRGKRIGYLLTFDLPSLKKEDVEVNLYERAGKVHFSVREVIDSD